MRWPTPACSEVFVALHEDGTTEQIERFAPVIAAFDP